MTIQQEIGKRGEALAVNFLREQGYDILEQNWRHRKAEIDIIAMDDDILVFVEVKTRSYTYFGPPESFVDKRKIKLMTNASHVYMDKIDHQWEVRFDVISILLKEGDSFDLRHIKEAFFLGL